MLLYILLWYNNMSLVTGIGRITVRFDTPFHVFLRKNCNKVVDPPTSGHRSSSSSLQTTPVVYDQIVHQQLRYKKTYFFARPMFSLYLFCTIQVLLMFTTVGSRLLCKTYCTLALSLWTCWYIDVSIWLHTHCNYNTASKLPMWLWTLTVILFCPLHKSMYVISYNICTIFKIRQTEIIGRLSHVF